MCVARQLITRNIEHRALATLALPGTKFQCIQVVEGEVNNLLDSLTLYPRLVRVWDDLFLKRFSGVGGDSHLACVLVRHLSVPPVSNPVNVGEYIIL